MTDLMTVDLVTDVARLINPYPFDSHAATFDEDYPESIRLRDREICAKSMREIRAQALQILELIRHHPKRGLEAGNQLLAVIDAIK